MRALFAISIGLLVFGFSSLGFSEVETPKPSPISGSDSLSLKREALIELRLQNQEKRMEESQKSGLLTPKDIKQLQKEQKRIKKMKSTAVADGKITPEEMTKIDTAIDQMSNDIGQRIHTEKDTAKQ